MFELVIHITAVEKTLIFNQYGVTLLKLGFVFQDLGNKQPITAEKNIIVPVSSVYSNLFLSQSFTWRKKIKSMINSRTEYTQQIFVAIKTIINIHAQKEAIKMRRLKLKP